MGDKSAISILIAHAAESQHGQVTRAQLLGLGVGVQAITYRVRTGELIRIHGGVYAVGYRRVEPVARAMAAVLACGPGALLSHDSAAALWGLRRWPDVPEVTAPEHRRRPHIHTHRSRTLQRADLRIQLNVPTVSAARAIFEIAPRLTDQQLTRATQTARLASHLKATDLHRLLGCCPRLQQLVDPDENPTRSYLEDIFFPWLIKHHLPLPKLNVRVNGREVDALYERERVIVELDSWEYHQDHATFASDRERDSDNLARGGYRTIRIIPGRLTDAKAEQLRTILQA